MVRFYSLAKSLFNIFDPQIGRDAGSNPMRYFTYIIDSESKDRWFYGQSHSTEQRLLQHNSGQNKSTKGRDPWELIFLREFETKREAVNFEMKLKKLKNKKYIIKTYSQFFISGCSAVR